MTKLEVFTLDLKVVLFMSVAFVSVSEVDLEFVSVSKPEKLWALLFNSNQFP